MSDDERASSRVARDAALQSLVSNLVYLVIMVGATVCIARRDWITQQWMRVQRWRHKPDPDAAAMEEVRRDIDRLEWGYSHRQPRDGGCGC